MKLRFLTWSTDVEQKVIPSYRPTLSPAVVATVLATMALVWPASAQQRRLGLHTGAPRWSIEQSVNRAAESRFNNANRNVRYAVTDIGVLPGLQSSFLPVEGSVNNGGVVAGYSYNGEFGATADFFLTAVGFTWEKGVLNALPLLSGWPGAFAFGLNERKQVYGVANNVDSQGNILQTAVIWDHGVPINLGTLQPNSNSSANGINNRGEVVGGSFSFDLNVETPFVWYKGQMSALPLLPNAVGGEADGINDRGEIVGFLDFGSAPPPGTGEFHPALWIPRAQGYSVQDLGELGGGFASAQYINNRGQVVGAVMDVSGSFHAFIWNDGELRLLDIDRPSYAYSINQRGQIVGLFLRDDGNLIDFLWEDGVLTDLNDVVPAGTPLLNGSPGGLNNRGDIGANAFLPDGTSVSFLLIPIHNTH